MKLKAKILLIVLAVVLAAAVAMLISGNSLFPVVFVGLVVLFLIYTLWEAPSKHKDFSYKDQQRAMRAFDRSDLIDAGKPSWAKGKKKSDPSQKQV